MINAKSARTVRKTLRKSCYGTGERYGTCEFKINQKIFWALKDGKKSICVDNKDIGSNEKIRQKLRTKLKRLGYRIIDHRGKTIPLWPTGRQHRYHIIDIVWG